MRLRRNKKGIKFIMNKSAISKSLKAMFCIFIVGLILLFPSGCKQYLCVTATDLDKNPVTNYKYGDSIICSIHKCSKHKFTLDTTSFDFYSPQIGEPINLDSLLSVTQKHTIDTFLVARKILSTDSTHRIVSIEFVDRKGNLITEMLKESKAYVKLTTEKCIGLPIELDFGEKAANHIIYNQKIMTNGKIINYMVFNDIEFIPIYISNEEITDKNHKYLLSPIPPFEGSKQLEDQKESN